MLLTKHGITTSRDGSFHSPSFYLLFVLMGLVFSFFRSLLSLDKLEREVVERGT